MAVVKKIITVTRKSEKEANMVEFESPTAEMMQSLLVAHVGKRSAMFLTHGAGGLTLKKVLLMAKSECDNE